jgi:peroxiredoxin
MKIFKKLFKQEEKIKIWAICDKIKSFQLTTHTGGKFSFNSKSRTKLLLYFFPNAWSDTNGEQILNLEKNYSKFIRFNLIP